MITRVWANDWKSAYGWKFPGNLGLSIIAVDLNRIARKIRPKRADAAKNTALCKQLTCQVSPFSHRVSEPQTLSLWDLERLKAGYGPHGKSRFDAAFWLAVLTVIQKHAGVRLAKYRFKRKPGAPDPDALSITLTGKHIPDTFQRALLWSLQRHGLANTTAKM